MIGLSFVAVLIIGGGVGVCADLIGLPSLGPVAAIAVSTAFIVHSLKKIEENGKTKNNPKKDE